MTETHRISSGPETRVLGTSSEVSMTVARDLLTEISTAQRQYGSAHVVLTGGTLGIQLLSDALELLKTGESDADLSHVDFWWGDERFTPTGSPDRNELQAREALLTPAEVPEDRIHTMGASDRFASAEEAAEAYAELLTSKSSSESALPRFDVLLLGMGPDGHVASLFPGTGLVNVQGVTTAVHDSPKPPSDRVSMTLDTINSARRVWLVVGGAEKAGAVASAFSGVSGDAVPAGAVRGVESTRWYLDEAAYEKAGERLR